LPAPWGETRPGAKRQKQPIPGTNPGASKRPGKFVPLERLVRCPGQVRKNHQLVLAGIFVLIPGRLLVDGILVDSPPVMLEFVADVSGEVVELFWLQPASANAVRRVIAGNVIIGFIGSLIRVDVF
jgi:hypothetical protein